MVPDRDGAEHQQCRCSPSRRVDCKLGESDLRYVRPKVSDIDELGKERSTYECLAVELGGHIVNKINTNGTEPDRVLAIKVEE